MEHPSFVEAPGCIIELGTGFVKLSRFHHERLEVSVAAVYHRLSALTLSTKDSKP